MKKILILCITLLQFSLSHAAPASDETIKELFAVSNTKSLIENMQNQMQQMLLLKTQQTLKNKKFTPQEEQILSKMNKKIIAEILSTINWQTLEPNYIEIYKKNFTEEQLKQIILFYKTEAGKSLINKMPNVIQESMHQAQALVPKMTESIQKILKETDLELSKIKK